MTRTCAPQPLFALSMANRISLGLIAVLAFGVAAAALRYVLPDMPGAAPPVAANAYAWPFLPLHAGLGALALILGPWQFLPRLRRTRPGVHRLIGSSYLIACLIAGGAGRVSSYGSTAGHAAGSGFTLLAIAWLLTSLTGAVLAVRGRFAAHRRWMVRSFALTLSAVTLRLQLGLGAAAEIDFATVYLLAAWGCWIPNLILAEIYLRFTAPSAAAGGPAPRAGG